MRNFRGYFTAGIFAGLTLLLVKLAKHYSDLLYSFYPFMSRTIMDFLAELSAGFSGSFWQTLVLLYIAILVVTIGVMIFTKYNFFRWLGWVLASVSVVVFLFMGVYGLNYYGTPLADRMLMRMEDYPVADLQEAAEYYLTEANKLSSQVPREGEDLAFDDFDTLAAMAPEGYKNLTQKYSAFGGTQTPVKPLGWSDLYQKMGITGITIGLTGEACVCPDIFPATLPFTMCHEMAHRKAITREDDANFAAFLACNASGDVQFRYSGYFMAYLYCRSALRSEDPAAASKLQAQESDLLRHDLGAYSAYLRQFEGKTQEKASAANDKYLKAVGQEKGSGSYDAVVDQLVNWYLQTWDPDLEVEEEPLFDPYHPEAFAPTEPTEETVPEESDTAA